MSKNEDATRGASRGQRTATLVERRDLTETLAIFRFGLEGGVPTFEAGQFLLLGHADDAGDVLWRAYSIASPPEVREHVELYIRLSQGEARRHLTAELWRLGVGDTVFWKPPRGRFTIADRLPDGAPDERRLLLLAGGTGVAPFVSQVLHLAHVGARREVVLGHGARHPRELGYHDLLSDLERRSRAGEPDGWRFRYLPTISRPDEPQSAGWTGHTGRVETLLRSAGGAPSAVEAAIGGPLDPRTTCVHVCGFDGTVAAVLAALNPLGFRPPEHPRSDGSVDVRFESYG